MKTYTNVLLAAEDIDVLRRAEPHLRVAFPAIDDAPAKGTKLDERSPDQQARIVRALIRDRGIGTHENIAAAVETLRTLVERCETEADLDHWLGDIRPPVSDDPTSSYRLGVTLAEIRSEQARDARAALVVMEQAASLTRPMGERQ